MSEEYSYKNRVRTITTWVSEEEKELCRLLKSEYDVPVAKEIYKAIRARIQELKNKHIPTAG